MSYDLDENTDIGVLTLTGSRLVTNIAYSNNTQVSPGSGIASGLPVVSLSVTIDAAAQSVIGGSLSITTPGTVDTPDGTVGPGTLLGSVKISGLAAYGSSIDMIFADPSGLLSSFYVADGPFIGVKLNNTVYNGDNFNSDFTGSSFGSNGDIFATPIPSPTAGVAGAAMLGLIGRRRRSA